MSKKETQYKVYFKNHDGSHNCTRTMTSHELIMMQARLNKWHLNHIESSREVEDRPPAPTPYYEIYEKTKIFEVLSNEDK